MSQEFRDKYEFYLFSGNVIMVERQTMILQNEGWELAGSITPYVSNQGYEGMLIPFKRIIKEDERG